MTTNRYCPRCGTSRDSDLPFCAACGERLDPTPPAGERHGKGGTPAFGLLLGVIGGLWLFAPVWSTEVGNLSIWQAHDFCSGLIGFFSPDGCSTITLYWGVGLGAVVVGIILALAAMLRRHGATAEIDWIKWTARTILVAILVVVVALILGVARW